MLRKFLFQEITFQLNTDKSLYGVYFYVRVEFPFSFVCVWQPAIIVDEIAYHVVM